MSHQRTWCTWCLPGAYSACIRNPSLDRGSDCLGTPQAYADAMVVDSLGRRGAWALLTPLCFLTVACSEHSSVVNAGDGATASNGGGSDSVAAASDAPLGAGGGTSLSTSGSTGGESFADAGESSLSASGGMASLPDDEGQAGSGGKTDAGEGSSGGDELDSELSQGGGGQGGGMSKADEAQTIDEAYGGGCPQELPVIDSECGVPGRSCTYGTSPIGTCRAGATCTNGRWTGGPSLCEFATDSCPEDLIPGGDCPTAMAKCLLAPRSECTCDLLHDGKWACELAPVPASECPLIPPNQGTLCTEDSPTACRYERCLLSNEEIVAACIDEVWTWEFWNCGAGTNE